MVHQRLLLSSERLLVNGINVFDDRNMSERYAIELLILKGLLSPAQIANLLGNGMHHAAIGSILMFVLSSIEMAI